MLDDVLSTAATNSGLRLVQHYIDGSLSYTAFATPVAVAADQLGPALGHPEPRRPQQVLSGEQDLCCTSVPGGRRPASAGRRPAAGGRRRRYRWIAIAAGAVIVVMTYFPIIFVLSNSLKSGKNIFTSGVFSLFTQFDYQNYVHGLVRDVAAAAQHDHRRGAVHRPRA